MTNILKILAVAATLVAGTGAALAGPDAAYHRGFPPDNVKSQPNIPHQSLGVESGIPPLYR